MLPATIAIVARQNQCINVPFQQVRWPRFFEPGGLNPPAVPSSRVSEIEAPTSKGDGAPARPTSRSGR